MNEHDDDDQIENVEIAFTGTPDEVIEFLHRHTREVGMQGGIWRITRDDDGNITNVEREH